MVRYEDAKSKQNLKSSFFPPSFLVFVFLEFFFLPSFSHNFSIMSGWKSQSAFFTVEM